MDEKYILYINNKSDNNLIDLNSHYNILILVNNKYMMEKYTHS